MSRPSDSEKEIKFYMTLRTGLEEIEFEMTLETFEVDLDTDWTHTFAYWEKMS